jgi:DNA-binding LacI/PurR family transcriptional regulator
LVRRYAVCYRTLRKALDDLVARGVLERANRRCRVPPRPELPAGSTVALVAAGYPNGSLHLFSPRTRDLVTALEGDCARSRASLMVSPFEVPRGSSRRPRLGRNLKGMKSTPLGLIVFQHGLVQDTLTDLVHQLLQFRAPIAVLDEGIGYSLPASFCRANAVRVFSIAFRPSVGRQVGQYLLGLGHRRAAYISVHAERAWSRNRLLGVRDAFTEAAGDRGSVTEFRSAVAPPVLADIERKEGAPLSEHMELLLRLRDIETLRNRIEILLRREVIRPLALPLLEQCLARRDITTWIAENDDLALECLDFLKSRHVEVPGEVSVMGFDDSMEGLVRGLTSYSFNCTAVVHALLSHVFNPRQAERFGGSYDPVEIEGFISHKGTVGPARGAVERGSDGSRG